jgi:hypothetical protein
VLVDPAAFTDLSASHMATDYSPYADLPGNGHVIQTWLQGRCIFDHDRFIGQRGFGSWPFTEPISVV